MPRHSTIPTLYEDLKSISISFLKEGDYFCGYRSGRVTWSRYGQVTSSLNITVSTLEWGESYLQFDYLYNGKPISYKVSLEKVPSNLGKGFRWYFRCPFNQKRCIKLYLYNGYFTHREAIPALYEIQTYSAKSRSLGKLYGAILGIDRLWFEEQAKPYTKKHYRGKPTPIMRKINRMEQIKKQFGYSDYP